MVKPTSSNINLCNTTAQVQNKLNTLLAKKQQYDTAYYTNSNPLVTDATYDELINQITTLTKQYPELNVNLTVGSSLNVDSGFNKQSHTMPMLSLDNLFTLPDLQNFDKRIKRFLNLDLQQQLEYSVELKIDGLSLALIYINGTLTYALSRGDGKIGEVLTDNAKSIANIPHTLSGNYPPVLEVRGEVYMQNQDFLTLNQQIQQQGKKEFANPRNAAAGSMRNLNANITKTRPLKFMAWGFGLVSNNNNFNVNNVNGNNQSADLDSLAQYGFSNSFYNNLNLLKSFGFSVSQYNQLHVGVTSVYNYYTKLAEMRSFIDYDVDGVVYKVNNIALQQRLGMVGKSPRWAAAHKFASYTAVSVVNNVIFQVGRTGVITPVAVLQPVNIGGVLVTRASLHNMDEIERKDIRIGDTVQVKRAGDVIPQIVGVNMAKRLSNAVKINAPQVCPVCGSPAVNVNSQVALTCSGNVFTCNAQLIGALQHFVSKEAFNIDGLGEKQIILFNKLGLIQSLADIFTLHKHKSTLLTLEGFGEKSVEKLLSAINSSASVSLSKFIYALGIKQIGLQTSTLLANYFGNVNNFITTFSNNNNLSSININGIGQSILADLFLYFTTSQNMQAIQQLLPYINISNATVSSTGGKLAGKTFLFTGTLSQLSRAEAKILVEKNGGIMLSAVSKNLHYLVAGEKAGSKLTKAQALNLTILTETDFIKMVN